MLGHFNSNRGTQLSTYYSAPCPSRAISPLHTRIPGNHLKSLNAWANAPIPESSTPTPHTNRNPTMPCHALSLPGRKCRHAAKRRGPMPGRECCFPSHTGDRLVFPTRPFVTHDLIHPPPLTTASSSAMVSTAPPTPSTADPTQSSGSAPRSPP